jgi:galactose mutarotase-like enzyme
VTEARQDFLAARLEWSGSNLLAVFPFRHCIELAATLCSESLTLETTVVASSEGPLPVSFGFHPYFGFAGSSRASWHLELPAMRKLLLDSVESRPVRRRPLPDSMPNSVKAASTTVLPGRTSRQHSP